MTNPPNWNEFEQSPAAPKAAAPSDDFDALCARIFNGNDGRRLLAELRKRHFDNGGNPNAPESALRVRASQQHFIRELEIACERGLTAATQRKPK